MKILVTGGSGFVSSRLIPALVHSGHEVLALSRSASSDDTVRARGAQPVRGDLQVAESLVLSAVDAVVHAGAHFRLAGPRPPYFRTNVDGTAALLAAAEKAGAARFVYLSAAAVIMDDRGTPVRGADENASTYPKSFSAYIASKARAEAEVLAADKPGFRTLALRPAAIWGPGDPFSTAIPHAIGAGQFSFVDRGDYAYTTTHVDNVVEATECALERGAGGRSYFVNDPETRTFREFIATFAERQRLSIDDIRSVPYRLAFTVARMMEISAILRRSKVDPPLTRTLVRLIGREFTTNGTAAEQQLGYVGKVTRAEGLATYGV